MRKLQASGIMFFFILLMTFNLQSQERYIDSNDYSYTGEVKSMSYMFYEAIEKNQQIVKGNRKVESIFDYDSRVSFDTLGRRTEILLFRSDNIPVFMEKYEYNGLVCNKSIYDVKGNQIESDILTKNKDMKDVEIIYNESVDSLKLKHTFKYDEKGNKTEWSISNEVDSLLSMICYFYDKNNKLSEVKCYSPETGLWVAETYQYSSDGRIIDNMRYKKSGEISNIVKYVCDDKGKNIETIWYTPEGVLIDKFVVDYNENGDRIKMYFYKSEEKLHQKDDYQYKYDQHGNWIEKITIRNDKPLKIIERKIEYY